MKPKFNLAAVLTAATALGAGGSWATASIQLGVSDRTGTFSGSDVKVDDRVLIDTGPVAGSGSAALYRVTAITAASGPSVTVQAEFVADGTPAPDLSWCLTGPAVIARPEALRGLLPAPSPGAQAIPDALCWQIGNINATLLEARQAATSIVTDAQGRVTSYELGGAAFVVTYGAHGVTAITRNGAPYLAVTYDGAGNPTQVVPQ